MVRLESPTPGLHIALDPRIPDELEKFAFRIAAATDARRVEWMLDDRVIATTQAADSSYDTFLWHPARGSHVARARVWRRGLDEPVETDPVSFVVK
jgi:penicillin-binding protein 1C